MKKGNLWRAIWLVIGVMLIQIASTELAVGQNVPKNLKYGDPNYVGKPITFLCRNCNLPNVVFLIAKEADIPIKFENADDWSRVSVTASAENRPWNLVLDETLARYSLKVVWVGDVLRVVPGENNTSSGNRNLSEWLKDIPPVPTKVWDLTTSGRAKEADRYFREGLNYFDLNTYPDTMKALHRFAWATELFEDLKFEGRQALSLSLLALALTELERKEEAFRACEEGIPLAHANGNQRIESFLNILGAFILLEKYNKKEEALHRADEVLRIIQQTTEEGRTRLSSNSANLMDRTDEFLFMIGALYYRAGEYKRSIDCLEQGLMQKPTDERHLGFGKLEGLVVMCKVQQQVGNKTETQKYQDQLRTEIKTTSDPRAQLVQKLNVGKTYLDLKDPAEALRWFQEAAPSVHAQNDYALEVSLQRVLGQTYLALKQPGEAKKSFEKALSLSQANNDLLTSQLVQEDLKQVK